MCRCNHIILVIIFAILTSCGNQPAPEPKEGYLFSRDSTRIYYMAEGTGTDTVFVIHGGPGAGINSFRPSVKILEQYFTMIYYDQRGGGRSGLPEEKTRLAPEYYIDDLEAVRMHFGNPKMNVIAHSFGAIFMAEYARRYPDNINRMVYHGATGPVLEEELRLRRIKAEGDTTQIEPGILRKAEELLETLLEGSSDNPVKDCREYEITNRIIARQKGEDISYKGSTCDMTPEAVAYYYQFTAQKAPSFYAPWDYSALLSEVKVPVLVLWGDRDSVMIPAQESWAKAYPEGRLLLVPGAGKASFSSNPEYTLRVVREFFSGKMPSASESY